MNRTFKTGLGLGIGLSLALLLIMGTARSSDAPSLEEHSPTGSQAINPSIGEVMLFAGNFAPRGFALCEGQLLPISQHSALFSILGTTYGGDGRTTFALPDLRGRVPIHLGQNGSYPLGQRSGGLFQGIPGGKGRGPMASALPNRDRAPYLTLNYCIALQGTYPSRN